MNTEDAKPSHVANLSNAALAPTAPAALTTPATGPSIAEVPVLRVPGWEQFVWLRHGFSTRAGGVSTIYRPQTAQAGEAAAAAAAAERGDLNLGWTADDSPELVAENRRRFTQAVWSDPAAAGVFAPAPTLITVRQVHSAVSLVVADGSSVAAAAASPDSANPGAAMVSASGRALCEGDGLITAAAGLLLGVQTADCVPVLVVDTTRRTPA